jgi:predicted enzyme related to lactoylglutathione lyase
MAINGEVFMQNPVHWFEIYVSKMNRAKTFYESLLKVKLTQMPFPEGEMWGFPSNPDKWGSSGSLVKMIPKLNGKIHKSKMSIGQYGFITFAVDTEGNMIGMHSMK